MGPGVSGGRPVRGLFCPGGAVRGLACQRTVLLGAVRPGSFLSEWSSDCPGSPLSACLEVPYSLGSARQERFPVVYGESGPAPEEAFSLTTQVLLIGNSFTKGIHAHLKHALETSGHAHFVTPRAVNRAWLGDHVTSGATQSKIASRT